MTATLSATDRYTIISADCHAGANHETYREYLDPAYLEDFDAWRNKYKNPFRDLQDGGRVRNWDNERRISDLERDGIVGEVVFPNTVPPFFPSFVLFAAAAEAASEYEHRLAGIRAHNRWLADWCGESPGAARRHRPDLPQRRRRRDRRREVDQGARSARRRAHLRDPARRRLRAARCTTRSTTGCGRCARTSRSRSTRTAAPARPNYGKYPVANLLFITEVSFYSQRPFVQFILSGVFERFPKLKFVMTEQGCAWIPPTLRRLDAVHRPDPQDRPHR